MTKEKLKELIVKAISVLELNKACFTPNFISTIDSTLNKINSMPEIKNAIAGLLGLNFNEIASTITSIKEFLEIEKMLTRDSVTEDILASLNKLKDRNFILSIIAGIL